MNISSSKQQNWHHIQRNLVQWMYCYVQRCVIWECSNHETRGDRGGQ